MGARRYVLRKLLHAVATVLFVLSFNFFLFRILPGDPVALLARSERLAPADVRRLQAELGLNLPLPQQFAGYVSSSLKGDLGVSLRTDRTVSAMIMDRPWPTVLLVGLGTLFSSLFGILIGIKGGWDRGSTFDTTSQTGSLVLYAMPEGWLGMLLLLLFSGVLGWFPAGGFETGGITGISRIVDVLDHLFLPLLTLTLGYVGQFSIVMRSSMIDTTHEEYVLSARAKGVPERVVRQGHVVPNAFLPTFTLIFLSFKNRSNAVLFFIEFCPIFRNFAFVFFVDLFSFFNRLALSIYIAHQLERLIVESTLVRLVSVVLFHCRLIFFVGFNLHHFALGLF